MKRAAAWAILAVMMLVMAFVPVEEAEAVDAYSKISIYGQTHIGKSHDSVCKLRLNNGNSGYNDMCGSGCKIYSFLHAIQWCNGEAWSESTAVSVAQKFIAAKNDPWNGEGSKYTDIAKAYGLKMISKPDTSSPSSVKAFFDKGACIILRIPGHFLLGVGYTERDVDGDGVKDPLVQVVDSSVSSTLKRMNNNGGYKGYTYSGFKEIGWNSRWYGDQYWIPLSTINKLFTLPYSGFIGGGTKTEIAGDGITTVDSISRIGISTKKASGEDQCFIKKTPEEAGETVTSIEKGKEIKITGAVKNKHGHQWYKTSDGYYVWEGDVEVWECSTMFSISAKFENSDGWRHSHVAPYLDSDNVENIFGGEDVVVTAFVKNSAGNIWAKLDDGSYLCFYDAGTNETKMRFLSFKGSPTVESVKKPEGDIKASGETALRGVIKAQGPILTVTSHVIDRSTNKEASKAGTPVTATPGLTTSANINTKYNGVNINSKTTISKLGTGFYSYYISVQHGFEYDGKTFTFGEPVKVITSEFNVGKGSAVYDYPITVVVDNMEALFTATKTHNAKNVPYAAGTTTREIANGLSYDVVQIVANSYGNLWAKLSTGDYVCYHDFEKNETYLEFVSSELGGVGLDVYPLGTVEAGTTITVEATAKTSVPLLSTMVEVGRTDGTWGICYDNPALKPTDRGDIPFGASFVIEKDKAGDYEYKLVMRRGFAYNGKTFEWKNSEYSGSFTVIDPALKEFTVIVDNMEATFEIGTKCNGHAYPYAASAAKADYKAGQQVKVVQIMENSHGNLWAKLSTGDFVCYYDAGIDKEHLTYVSMDHITKLTESMPDGTVYAGDAITVSVTVDSSAPVIYMDYIFRDKSTGEEFGKTVAMPSVAERKIDANVSLTLDEDQQGEYWCRLVMTTGFEGAGKWFHWDVGYIAESTFTVVPSEQPSITNAVTFRADSVPGTPGQAVTVPFYMENPQQVLMGALELQFDLPEGVTIAAIVKNGDLADAVEVINAESVVLADMNGFNDNTRILDVVFNLPKNVHLPLTVSVTAIGGYLDGNQGVHVEMPDFSFQITNGNAGRVPGDANEDGEVDIFDSLLILQYYAGWDVTVNEVNSEVNGDGIVDIFDSLLVLQYYAGWDVQLQ